MRRNFDGYCHSETNMSRELSDNQSHEKPTDEECLELLRQFRTGEFRRHFKSLNAYDEAEQEVTARLNVWFPGIFRYMNTMSDQDALALAKAKGKVILL